MGIKDNQDINNLMEFRDIYWHLWIEFVKDNDDYCRRCHNHKEYCDC